jgi:hypothetical protein
MVLSERAANTEPEPVLATAPVVHADGCPECGGAKYGKGFRHTDGCTKSTVRPKVNA